MKTSAKYAKAQKYLIVLEMPARWLLNASKVLLVCPQIGIRNKRCLFGTDLPKILTMGFSLIILALVNLMVVLLVAVMI